MNWFSCSSMINLKCGINVYIVALFCGISIYLLVWNLEKFSVKRLFLEKTETSPIVPKVVHYVIFGSEFSFISFISITSVLKVQKPSVVLVHADNAEKWALGDRWRQLGILADAYGIKLEVHNIVAPTHVFGHRLSSIYHASDILRLLVLFQFGGIYLDTDVVVLQQLAPLVHAECTIGLQDNEYVGTQVVAAVTGARLIKLWLESYKWYKGWSWYENAGRTPVRLVKQDPTLAKLVPKLFGVHMLLSELHGHWNWTGWHDLYAVHLLVRHDAAASAVDEHSLGDLKTPFGDICRWVLYTITPPLLPSGSWDLSLIKNTTENSLSLNV